MDYDLDDMKMILAPCALIICILWDIGVYVVRDYLNVEIPSWIPTNLFVLSALTIQILGYVDVTKVNVFGASNEKELQVLVDKQLKMDAARLTMCVFVGCLLPGMATLGNVGRWSNVAALFVTLPFHIATEIYALQNVNDSKVQSEAGPWFVSSGVVLLLGASSLLFLLGVAILFGKALRDTFRPDVIDVENEGAEWKTLGSEVMKSWVAVRAWKTWYFITSSDFSPGPGIIVTICVAVMAAKVGCRSFLLHRNNGGGNLTFYLQCIFILVGWILMLCRWFKRSLYCPQSRGEDLYLFIKAAALVEKRVIVVYCPRLANIFKNPGDFSIQKFKWRHILISLTFAVLLLPLLALILAFCLLLLFCYICCRFSNLVFSSNYVQHLCKLDKKAISVEDVSSEYKSTLMDFNVDDQRTFWMLNKKSYDRIKGRMDEAHKKAESCTVLHSIMVNSGLDQIQRLRRVSTKYRWMEIMSTIFRAIADIDIGVDMVDAFEAYRETKDVLKFVDCPENIDVDPLNIFGTLNFYDISDILDSMWHEERMLDLEREFKQGTRVGSKFTTEEWVGRLNRSGEEMFNNPLIRPDATSYVEELRALVGRVIVSCLLEAPDVIGKYTKQCVQSLDEGKIEGATELAGKVKGLLEKLVKDGDLRSSTETGEVPSQRAELDIEDRSWLSQLKRKTHKGD